MMNLMVGFENLGKLQCRYRCLVSLALSQFLNHNYTFFHLLCFLNKSPIYGSAMPCWLRVKHPSPFSFAFVRRLVLTYSAILGFK